MKHALLLALSMVLAGVVIVPGNAAAHGCVADPSIQWPGDPGTGHSIHEIERDADEAEAGACEPVLDAAEDARDCLESSACPAEVAPCDEGVGFIVNGQAVCHSVPDPSECQVYTEGPTYGVDCAGVHATCYIDHQINMVCPAPS